jgi:hypothetical protein
MEDRQPARHKEDGSEWVNNAVLIPSSFCCGYPRILVQNV